LSGIKNLESFFTGRKLIVPLLLGLFVAFYFFFRDFDNSAYDSVSFTKKTIQWLVLGLGMIAVRLLGYMYRLRILSDNQLSWTSCLQLVILWEFSSAISPGIVGGTAAAFLLLSKEKTLSPGKSTTIVLATSYLDVLFYVVAVPIFMGVAGLNTFIPDESFVVSSSTIKSYFIISYSIFIIWAVLVHIGLFIRPSIVKSILVTTFRLPILRRWSDKAKEWGKDIEIAAKDIAQKGIWYWLKLLGVTSITWVARFSLVNFLVLAFGSGFHFVEILGKQLVMFGILLIPATPGAIGMAEGLFLMFLNPYFDNPQLTNTVAVLWRLLSYWPYLFAGLMVFPIWIRRIILENEQKRK
jgi:uncharacterized protein (TIRG00374 family)